MHLVSGDDIVIFIEQIIFLYGTIFIEEKIFNLIAQTKQII